VQSNQHRETIITLNIEKRGSIPEEFKANDNRFPESLVEYILDRYTKEGDKVIDLFAGLGTVLFVSEEKKRIPYGIEYDRKRYEFIKAKLKLKNNVIHGDALKLNEYTLPKFDLCFGSPPYMMKDDAENPFTCCTTEGNYEQYLNDIRSIYSNLKKKMNANSHVILEVSNLKGERGTTMLAWDIAKSVAEVLYFTGEIVVGWENRNAASLEGTYGYGYDHSYCLVFTA